VVAAVEAVVALVDATVDCSTDLPASLAASDIPFRGVFSLLTDVLNWSTILIADFSSVVSTVNLRLLSSNICSFLSLFLNTKAIDT
jgi:hypothetical protein